MNPFVPPASAANSQLRDTPNLSLHALLQYPFFCLPCLRFGETAIGVQNPVIAIFRLMPAAQSLVIVFEVILW